MSIVICKKCIIKTILIMSCLVLFPTLALASTGTVNSTNRYAWSENAGWIDFGSAQGNVQITDSELTGYAYSPKIGWISLNCSNDSSCETVSFKVSNDGSGNLSGYAYSENAGYIDFQPQGTTGVKIDSSGVFSNYAYSPKIGWVVFNCVTTNSCDTVNYKVSSNYAYAGSDTPVVTGGGNAVQVFFNKPILKIEPYNSAEIQNLLAIIEKLKAQIQDLINKKLAMQLPQAQAPQLNTQTFQFTKNLKIIDVDLQVKHLQQFLNTHGFVVTVSGPGSLNNETTKFGSATKTALKKFQQANNLKVTGIFDEVTRSLVNAIIK